MPTLMSVWCQGTIRSGTRPVSATALPGKLPLTSSACRPRCESPYSRADLTTASELHPELLAALASYFHFCGGSSCNALFVFKQQSFLSFTRVAQPSIGSAASRLAIELNFVVVHISDVVNLTGPPALQQLRSRSGGCGHGPGVTVRPVTGARVTVTFSTAAFDGAAEPAE